nr:MAG TPA: hypothetical protein [Caudoviricetes sp.]
MRMFQLNKKGVFRSEIDKNKNNHRCSCNCRYWSSWMERKRP